MPKIIEKSAARRFVTVILQDRGSTSFAEKLRKRVENEVSKHSIGAKPLEFDPNSGTLSESSPFESPLEANSRPSTPRSGEIGAQFYDSEDQNDDSERDIDEDDHEAGPTDSISVALSIMSSREVADTLEDEQGSVDADVDYMAIRETWERLSLSTRKTYALELKRLATIEGWEDPSPQASIAKLAGMGKVGASNAIRRYRDHGQVSSATRARRVHAVSSLLKALHKAGAIAWEPSAKAPVVVPEQDRSGPPIEDVNKLIEATRTANDEDAARDYALILMLFDQALRRSEACGLRVKDLDLAGARASVARKGDHGRRTWIPISQRTALAMRAYLASRPTMPEDPAFPSPTVAFDEDTPSGRSSKPMPLSGRSIGRILERRASAAGLKGIRPHGLRHTALTVAASTFDSITLSQFAGHKDPKTTRIYIDNDGRMTRPIAEHIANAGKPAAEEDESKTPRKRKAAKRKAEDDDDDFDDVDTFDLGDDAPF